MSPASIRPTGIMSGAARAFTPARNFGIRPTAPLYPAANATRNNRGVNRDRQSRFDSRSRRRGGDWDILEVATPLLWLEDGCLLATCDPMACTAMAVADLWP